MSPKVTVRVPLLFVWFAGLDVPDCAERIWRTRGHKPMMLQELMDAMAAATKGSREFDAEIAKFLGWRTRPMAVKDGRTGDITRRTVWVDPKTNEPGSVPFYTSDLQASYDLMVLLYPREAVAVVVEDRIARVQIADSEMSWHADPAVAVCLGAIKRHSIVGA